MRSWIVLTRLDFRKCNCFSFVNFQNMFYVWSASHDSHSAQSMARQKRRRWKRTNFSVLFSLSFFRVAGCCCRVQMTLVVVFFFLATATATAFEMTQFANVAKLSATDESGAEEEEERKIIKKCLRLMEFVKHFFFYKRQTVEKSSNRATWDETNTERCERKKCVRWPANQYAVGNRCERSTFVRRACFFSVRLFYFCFLASFDCLRTFWWMNLN